jgi:LAGLIDADG endonuclease
MNYFLPIHVGAPDYFKYLNKLLTSFYSIDINNYNNLESSSDLSNIKDNTSKFHSIGPYLAGLFEGDGHIILSKKINSKGKISYPYIAITFVNKDLPLVNKFIELFGGRLRFKNKENAIVWIINTHKELVNLIKLMNGNLRTPKISQFNDLIAWLNDRYHYNIPIYFPDTSDLNNNGWLAGFIDADGGFKIRYTEKRIEENSNKVLTKGRIEVRFALEQRQYLPYNNQSYKPIMLKIQSFFGITTELKISKHNLDKTYWIIEVTSLNKLNLLIQYLNNYPLLTAKRNDFDDWLKVYHLMIDKQHLIEDGKLLIKHIKSNMNKNREEFNWNHLIYLNNVQ